MNFRLLTIDDRECIERYSSGRLGWENSFACIWAWNVHDKHLVHVDKDFTVLLNYYNGKQIFSAPYCADNESFLRGIQVIEQYCRENNTSIKIANLSKEQVGLIDNSKYIISTNRNSYDYVYNTSDLIGLAGKKYHSKRNFIKRFAANYDYTFRDYVPTDYDGVSELFDVWVEGRDPEDVKTERIALMRTIENFDKNDLVAAVIEIDGKIVGFSAGQVVGNVGHTLFEKADTSYDGIYPTINNLFAQKYYSSAQYINRQEDLGLEGLRKAKLSYHPAILLEKYSAVLK